MRCPCSGEVSPLAATDPLPASRPIVRQWVPAHNRTPAWRRWHTRACAVWVRAWPCRMRRSAPCAGGRAADTRVFHSSLPRRWRRVGSRRCTRDRQVQRSRSRFGLSSTWGRRTDRRLVHRRRIGVPACSWVLASPDPGEGNLHARVELQPGRALPRPWLSPIDKACQSGKQLLAHRRTELGGAVKHSWRVCGARPNSTLHHGLGGTRLSVPVGFRFPFRFLGASTPGRQ